MSPNIEHMDDRKNTGTPIPLPPQKVREIKPLPKKRFFKDLSVATITRREEGNEKVSRLPRGIWWGVLGLLFLFVVGFTVSFFVVRRSVSDIISSRASMLRAGISDLRDGNPVSAAQEFSSLSSNANGLGPIAQSLGFFFQGSIGSVAAFTDGASQFAHLSQELISLENDVFQLWSGGGTDFISNLKLVRATLAAINIDSNELSSEMPSFGTLFGEGNTNTYLALEAQSEDVQKFLNAFIPWVSETTPHHVLIMLQNPSEIRPAGGFLGSYADVTIASGTITDISIHDVADVDTAFTRMIVPPKPLQLEVSRWRPADANWFFDFPTSASETIAFFNESNLYATTSPDYFDAAIAVSPKVVSDLLSVTGPITVSSTKTIFTADDFLVQIQKIVQAGQASLATYPKQVLRDLVAQLSARLASSTDAERQSVVAMAENWAADKDIVVYSNNQNIENFTEAYGFGGDIYTLPQNFNGDYLAVVDANVNGGKSDLYVSEKVNWTSQIGADGTLTDSLIIDRKDGGNISPYWWYKTPNQVYLQVFVSPDSLLTDESGGVEEKISPSVNYAANGYSTDPLVAAIESSTQILFGYPAVTEHEEDGKMVFATWSTVKAGSSSELSFDYTHYGFASPAPGVVYQFIFEKQAGTNRSYSLEVDAPLGYQFTETGLPSWTYQSDNLPGRMVVNLTLKPI